MSGSTADVSVRVAWADDAPAIAEVQLRAWPEMYGALVPLTAAGWPVLAAGGVALLAGVLTRTTIDPTEVPGPDDVAGGHR